MQVLKKLLSTFFRYIKNQYLVLKEILYLHLSNHPSNAWHSS